MTNASPRKTSSRIWLLGLWLSACSFDLADHPAACKTSSDCKLGYVCEAKLKLCVREPKGGSAGSSANAGASGGAGTHAAGTGGGGSGASGSAGTTGLDASMTMMDSGSDADLDASDLSDGALDGSTTDPTALATCSGWTEPKAPICPPICSGGCDRGVCHIACEGIACITHTVTCPKLFACRVSCTDANSCTSMHVNCDQDAPCDVVCTGTNACTSATVDCGNDACRVTCGNSNVVTFVPGTSCAGSKPGCL